jgi:hypothetical protein
MSSSKSSLERIRQRTLCPAERRHESAAERGISCFPTRAQGCVAQRDISHPGDAGCRDAESAARDTLRTPKPQGRSVLVTISCTTRALAPRNISFGARFLWASANAGLLVHATKSSNVRHHVFTS